MKNLEIYNYKRRETLFNIDVTNGKIYVNNIDDIIMIDKLNTSKFKLKLVRFILRVSLTRQIYCKDNTRW